MTDCIGYSEAFTARLELGTGKEDEMVAIEKAYIYCRGLTDSWLLRERQLSAERSVFDLTRLSARNKPCVSRTKP